MAAGVESGAPFSGAARSDTLSGAGQGAALSGSGRILVTGAGGFLGRAIVAAARGAGHEVVALTRASAPAPEWAGDAGVRHEMLDLAAPGAAAALAGLLGPLPGALTGALTGGGVTAVIHAAARLSGDDAAHASDTLGPTRAVIEALTGADAKIPLVLVSSFSVYGYAALPDWAVLDETTPVEPRPARRDAYARAKIAQEEMAIAAARTRGLDLRILRPGVIYGPGRTGTAWLGFAKAGRVICPGGEAPVPAIHVDHCATALVRAATIPPAAPSDLPVPEIEGEDGSGGAIAVINLVDPDPPRQSEWLAAAPQGRVVELSRGGIFEGARLLEWIARRWKWFGRKLPASLHEESLAARFKPLRYSTARAEARLGHRPARSFAEAMAASRQDGNRSMG